MAAATTTSPSPIPPPRSGFPPPSPIQRAWNAQGQEQRNEWLQRAWDAQGEGRRQPSWLPRTAPARTGT